MGKNVTNATSSTLGSSPKPNHSTTRGASAMRGRVWPTISSGRIAPRRVPEKSRAEATTNATVIDRMKPRTVAASVGAVCLISTSHWPMPWPATCDGAGRTLGSTMPVADTVCHTIRSTAAAMSGGTTVAAALRR